jgi:hypothetical protein
MKKQNKQQQVTKKNLLATGWQTVEVPFFYYSRGNRIESKHIKYRHPALSPRPIGLLGATAIYNDKQQLKLGV